MDRKRPTITPTSPRTAAAETILNNAGYTRSHASAKAATTDEDASVPSDTDTCSGAAYVIRVYIYRRLDAIRPFVPPDGRTDRTHR
jgi:hypothetical protein